MRTREITIPGGWRYGLVGPFPGGEGRSGNVFHNSDGRSFTSEPSCLQGRGTIVLEAAPVALSLVSVGIKRSFCSRVIEARNPLAVSEVGYLFFLVVRIVVNIIK